MAAPALVDRGSLTSRERVRRVLKHQEPDRVPLNYGANGGVDRRLKAHFGLAENDGEGLLRALGVDFRGVGPRYTGPVLHSPLPGRQVDPLWGARCKWVAHSSGGYWDFCDFPLAGADAESIANWPLPSPDDFDYEWVRTECRRHEGRCIYVGHPGLGDIMNSYGFVRGVEQAMCDLAEEYEPALRLIDRRADLWWEVTRRTLEIAGGRIDMMWLGEDLGAQRGPLISMPMFRRTIRPRLERFTKLAQEHGVPVMIHSCGSSSWAFEDFIAMGVAAVDTLQPEAANMAPAYLKATFGGRLAFHGCISTGGPIAFGTAEETAAMVRRTLEIMMPGGGYCCAPTHALQDNSPVANVMAMYEAAHRHGVYR